METPTSAAQLLQKIAQHGFALMELNLYLDTHPSDDSAFDGYVSQSRQLGQLKEQYIREYGPLINFGNGAHHSGWLWNDQPWPWETKGRE